MKTIYQGETAWFIIVPRGNVTAAHAFEARVVDRSGDVVATLSSEAEDETLKITPLTDGKWGFRLSPALTATLLGEYLMECWVTCDETVYLLSRHRFRVCRSTRGETTFFND